LPADIFDSSLLRSVQIGFLLLLIIISGICTSFSRNLLKRGAILYLLGQLITIITSIIIPGDVVVFGILSFLGLSMLIYAICKPLMDKIPWSAALIFWTGLSVIFFDFPETHTIHLFVKDATIPEFLRTNKYLYPLGITTSTFISSDYFPLIPWMFIFFLGTVLSVPITQKKFPKWFYQIRIPFMEFLGRNSLVIYILHQPVIYGILLFIF
jgi:uncharacterized membrane protein